MDLTAESGELMDISFTAENSGVLRVEAAAHFTDALAPVIPDDVLTAIHSGSNDDASTLTDNALRLLGAWGELTADDLSADIALSKKTPSPSTSPAARSATRMATVSTPRASSSSMPRRSLTSATSPF